MRKHLLVSLAILLCGAGTVSAQYEGYFGENKIAYDKFDWQTYKTTHFTIYFYTREQVTLNKVASYAESAYDDVSRQLNYQIPKSINLIFYASHSDFEQTNTLLNFIPEGVGAFALPSRNRMVLPVDVPDEKLQQLIQHELTHVFQFEILFGGNFLRAATTNAPQWFMEGMASYFGNDEDNKDRMVLRDAVLSDQVPEIAQRGIEGFFAYRFGHAVFDFISAEWGKDAVRDFVFEFRNQIGPSVERAVKRSFNITAEEFDIKFRRYLRRRYLKILTEKGEPVDFGERFKVEDTPSAELSPRAYPSGDFVAAISTYKNQADVVVMSTRERKLFKNLTKGYTTEYEYIVSQWVTTGPQIGADLSVSPDGNTIAVFARRERGRDLLLVNALEGGVRERIEMPGLDQQLNPAFSPDGKTVVFRGVQNGRSDIYSYDIGTHAIVNLTNDQAYSFAPTFSPDGRWIYYCSVSGTKSKIFRFHPESPESREQITYGDWNDEDPAVSPDGKRLFFTSDRDEGIYNIYSMDLETGEMWMHTNVVAGALCPTVFIGKDNSEKLVFTAYFKRRFTLYISDARKAFRKLQELAPVPSPTGPQGYRPFQPAIEVAVDPDKFDRKPSHKLYIEDAWVNAGINTDQTFLSNTVLVFGDNLGDRRFVASIQSVSSFTSFDFVYYDLSKRLQKGVELFDTRTYFTTLTDQGGGTIVRTQQAQRYTGGYFLGTYPVSRYERVEGQVGFISRAIDYPFVVTNVDGSQAVVITPRTDNYPTLNLAWVHDTADYEYFGPLSGSRLRIGGNYAPDFNPGQTPGADGHTLTAGVNADLRFYLKVFQRSLFAIRLYGAHSVGNFPDIYYFGGLDTLRGLDYASAIGNTIGYANFEYRFPLIDLLAFPIGGFQGIRGRVFFDIGGAALKDQNFKFWDSSNHRLIDGIASYGFGFEINLLGLPLHWDFARLTDLKSVKSSFKTAFYIGPVF